ncbi:hypothetical protein AKJ09_01613 [Labilithrix luteola]|uniref:Heavy metal binding domain-containing protein n=1 Tax=Labilithrix luteola TaxID=1391654 RepID=A0A0K1PP99_9BACT|nr:heavy metal-binding domain-containing protein [Labilithrix luteola]AKU94949.1 hypothetical protein AKJ09_01613 [Labilithrix luteola]
MKHHRTAFTTTSRASFLKLGLAAALLPLLGACSPAPMPISRSASDPSSPSAPDGVNPLAAQSTSAPVLTGAAQPAHEHHEHHEHHDHAAHAAHPGEVDHAAAEAAGAEGVVYVCPMHPEVTSTKAGELCPKCNMKLVPKK